MRVAALGFVVLIALSGCDQLGLGQRTAQTVAPPQVAAAPPEQMTRTHPAGRPPPPSPRLAELFAKLGRCRAGNTVLLQRVAQL